ncbi:hypothetical protein H112_01286 [Trichophyton rubrum D6]|uniref:Uncharacterized protein n=3 Tax=Trichophyton TaxID=5550 RepID=A0A080WM39_TRIRC|nr:uncharacterized protein TERG_12581 [Trichophyton rubrum CBS 118892]EZF26602.1 hypothetical protein H100_01281 [Trichophyton rubrum MR850]EZF45637.1 hypothetical protein H102_01276 [Trichophyton rubrum CBS 100081]EZF56283.1 hypothetical protein H103_01285 [Trichophyton rubrum CBS 288.86]EZF66903.1 hypothetical protein H104_01269 [Trichophyton rubrum CBS 289.86]EZF77551.1 hypothetical protein H105_01290 [Trichophyton soudanense CBS 452.61]EZF88196.1 hypothetical protein H110_01285 [Trichophy
MACLFPKPHVPVCLNPSASHRQTQNGGRFSLGPLNIQLGLRGLWDYQPSLFETAGPSSAASGETDRQTETERDARGDKAERDEGDDKELILHPPLKWRAFRGYTVDLQGSRIITTSQQQRIRRLPPGRQGH